MIPTADLRALDRRAVHLIRSVQANLHPNEPDRDVSGIGELEDHCPVLKMIRRPAAADCSGSFPSVQLVRALRRWHLHQHLQLGRGWGFANEMTAIEHQLDSIEPTNRSGQTIWFLIRALLTGPVYLQAMEPGIGAVDLEAFAGRALDAGLPVAVLAAIDTTRELPVTGDDIEVLGDQLAEFAEAPQLELVGPPTTTTTKAS